jgi:hypothetical protein
MERRGIHMGFLWESQEVGDYWEDVDVCAITLKWISNRMVCIGLTWITTGTSGEL